MQGNVQHAISTGFCRDPGEWIRPSGPGQELGQGIGAGNCCRVLTTQWKLSPVAHVMAVEHSACCKFDDQSTNDSKNKTSISPVSMHSNDSLPCVHEGKRQPAGPLLLPPCLHYPPVLQTVALASCPCNCWSGKVHPQLHQS